MADDDQHWVRWHAAYEDPDSALNKRLVAVQGRLRAALDRCAEGPIRLISMCAGQGRDVIGVLADHPRRDDVAALLVELDHPLVVDGRALAAAAGLDSIEIVEGDASTTSPYASGTPADVVLVCGVFGNVSGEDIRATIAELPHLCAPGATVIWTRHRRDPDITPTIRAWFDELGFEEVGFDTEEGAAYGVGINRLVVEPRPFRPDHRLFTFQGDGADAHF